MSHSPHLRIILGATASGKESLALAVAQRLNGEIVSVDSMKIYRRLDIATAKATARQRALVPHHCLDLADPEITFSAADYVQAADKAIADICGRGRIPILSGGTAFYYKALLEGLFEGPGADPALRRQLEDRAESEGSEALHRELTEKDPAAAAKIHPSDLRRLIRALEVVTLTGKGISSSQTQWADFHHPDPEQRAAAFFQNPRYPFTMYRVTRDRADIHRRIAERIGRMAETGLEEEARRVWENRERISRTPLQAVGYKEFFPYFSGEITWPEALEKLRLGTNRLVRSQDTWFRKFPAQEVAMQPDDDVEQVADMLTAGERKNMRSAESPFISLLPDGFDDGNVIG